MSLVEHERLGLLEDFLKSNYPEECVGGNAVEIAIKILSKYKNVITDAKKKKH